ncbi:SirB2 family protein [Parvibaculum sp.]|uniref:SirB2 family protein n=1 Tax=Parvibaculum sp. TaxID=2024848 RepID=UPI0032EEB417
MIEFYAEIRLVHIWSVILSGTIFFLRGLALLAGEGKAPGRIAMSMPVKLASYTVDTVLLTAALMLMTVVQQYPFIDPWLTVKVVLLAVSVGLGVAAFRFARTRAERAGLWAAALAVFLFIVSVARAHDALGIFAG